MKKFLSIWVIAIVAVFLAGCQNQSDILKNKTTEVKTVNLSNVMEEIKKNITLVETMSLGKEDLIDYYGIDLDDIVQEAIEISNSGLKADEIVMIEAKDAEAALRIKQKLEARYNMKLNESKNYNAKELEVIKKCAVEVNDNYVSMLCHPEYEKILEIYNKSVLN